MNATHYAFPVFVMLVACSSSGQTTGDGGTDGATDGGAVPCPSAIPSDGTACTPQGTFGIAGCEYGGDARGQCATIAECYANGKWHITAPTAGCGVNMMACPATFGALAEGSACPLSGGSGTCMYAEGACGCAPCSSDGGLASQWKCRTWASAGMGCPSPRALLGSACTTEGQLCDWNACCSGVSLGRSATCTGGQWHAYASGACSCALFACK